MTAVRKAPMLKKPSKDDVDAMVISHERALFGYTDRDSLRVVPGLLARIDEAHSDIATVKSDVTTIKAALADMPEVSAILKFIKRAGAVASLVVILLLLALVFRQYELIPLILRLGH